MNQTALLGALLMAATVVTAQQPATNYDETKVPSYTLPPLLAAKDGSAVRTAADWTKRRGEIRALLEDQKGLDADATMPGVDQPVGDGHVRYHVRTGKHDITAYDWQQYLDFAARHFEVKPASTGGIKP